MKKYNIEFLREQFEDTFIVAKDQRMQSLADRRFYSVPGAQWEGMDIVSTNKPMYEVNKVHLAVIRIINEYRNNRVSVSFVPKDGTNNDELADTCASLHRADEQRSVAEEAYDNAFEEGAGGGMGAWRYRAEYEDESDEENQKQKVCIEPIYDADSTVFFDLQSKRQDKADASWCYVLTSMSREAYKEEYGDDPSDWPKEVSQSQFDWAQPDSVIVAEYYVVEKVSKTLETWRALDGGEEQLDKEELDEDGRDELIALGKTLVRSRKVKKKKIRKLILSGSKILEDLGYIVGDSIPIVVSYGKRWIVDGIERFMGHCRLATDLQRIKNLQYSNLALLSTKSLTGKPIFTPEQMAGHELLWAEDDKNDYAYLLINPTTSADGQKQAAGPVAMLSPPPVPPAMAALLQLVDADIQEVLGNQQAAEQLPANVSGHAIELVQNKLDMQAFIYMSNFAKARKRGGEIWLGMAKEIYGEEGRKLKTLDDKGKPGSIELKRPGVTKDGIPTLENDLSKADLDVDVQVGPSSDSKRASTVRALTGMMTITQDPETSQVLQSMAMMNMEGEGIVDVRDYFRKKLLRLGAVKPTDEEKEQLAKEAAEAAKPTPDAQYLMAQAEKSAAEAQKIQADTAKVMQSMMPGANSVEQIKRQTEEIKAETAMVQAAVELQNTQACQHAEIAGIIQALQALASSLPAEAKSQPRQSEMTQNEQQRRPGQPNEQ